VISFGYTLDLVRGKIPLQSSIKKQYKKGKIMNKTRPKQILIRVSESEFKAIKLKVSESKIKQNEYLLRCLLDKNIIVIDGLREITVELKRIGNNVNQITKSVHQGNNNPDLSEVNEELKDIWQSLRQLIRRPEET